MLYACDCSRRVYWDAARNEMETLATSWLVDEFEQTLHSKTDYAAALDHLLEMCPELGEYMAEFQLVLTGDHPTWKYNKKLHVVAEVVKYTIQHHHGACKIKS